MVDLIRIFFAPGEVFASIPEKPRWYFPFASSLLLSCLASALIINSIGMETLVRRQLQSQPQLVERLGEEKIDEIVEQSNSPARQISAYIGSILSSGLVILGVALILTVLLALTGTRTGFKSVFSVTAYSYFAYYSLLFFLSAITLLAINEKENIDPGNLLLSHAGAFFDRATTNRALFSIARSLDLFSLGLVSFLALGLSKISARVTFTRSLAIVGGVWGVYVAIKAGFSSLF